MASEEFDEVLNKIYRRLYEERKPASEEVFERIKDRSAIGLVRDLIFQLNSYRGQYIHNIHADKRKLELALSPLEESVSLMTTIEELRTKNPNVFYQLVGDALYCMLYSNEKAKYAKFLIQEKSPHFNVGLG